MRETALFLREVEWIIYLCPLNKVTSNVHLLALRTLVVMLFKDFF